MSLFTSAASRRASSTPAAPRVFAPMLVALSAALTPVWALAQSEEPVCAAMDVSLPPALAAWATPIDIVSAPSAADLEKASITPGAAARVTLQSAGKVAYPIPPAKPGGPATYGGLLAFTIRQPGTWRVALSSGAWIDVTRDGQPQVSIAHGHGPACSTIHKMVDFSLRPGAYVLQISGAPGARIDVLVARTP